MSRSKQIDEDEFTEWVRETRRPMLVKLADWLKQFNSGHIATLLAHGGIVVVLAGGVTAAIQVPLPGWARIIIIGAGMLISAGSIALYRM